MYIKLSNQARPILSYNRLVFIRKGFPLRLLCYLYDMRKTTVSRKIVIAILMAAALVVLIVVAIAIAVPLALMPADFRMGFDHCCSDTASVSNLTDDWITDCLNQYSNFQQGFVQANTSYYSAALLGLGMHGDGSVH